MTDLKSTKRALFSSIIALFICFALLIGTTFAWFTDTVNFGGNIIQSGTLNAGMYWAEGKEDPTSVVWKDASQGSIFNNDKWEPGYVESKHLKITNEGTLALKYKLLIVPNGAVQELADVIDVYFVEGATLLSRATLASMKPVGTLRDMISDEDGAAHGALLPVGEVATNDYERVGEVTATLAFKMRESAGNEYQGKQIGTDFAIQLYATQYTYEEDSFDNSYDADATYRMPVSSWDALFTAIENGDDVLLETPLVVDESYFECIEARSAATTFTLNATEVVDTNATIDGNGTTIYRTEDTIGVPLFTVNSGYTLTLSNVTIDGGAIWTGDKDPVLLRSLNNSGLATTAYLIATVGTGSIVLNENAILQNNGGASAVGLASRGGGSITINGGQIINNTGNGGGAIWGGGDITLNSGKINGNHSVSLGGAIRTVGNFGTITMNGGEMNHNSTPGTGGAIWGGGSWSHRTNNNYFFNGGEMNYNYSGGGGGAIYTGNYEVYKISGDFEMAYNVSDDLGAAIRFCSYTSFTMTGGSIHNNVNTDGSSVLYGWNAGMSIVGGKIYDNNGTFVYQGGVSLVLGNVEIAETIRFDLSTNHNTGYLDTEFVGFAFIVNANDEHFLNFNLKPADGYVYTEGDEDKFVCLNEGYVLDWDDATKTFRLRADD